MSPVVWEGQRVDINRLGQMPFYPRVLSAVGWGIFPAADVCCGGVYRECQVRWRLSAAASGLAARGAFLCGAVAVEIEGCIVSSSLAGLQAYTCFQAFILKWSLFVLCAKHSLCLIAVSCASLSPC